MRTLVTSFLAASLLAGAVQAEVRTWSDASGQSQVQAEMVGATKDGKVMLRLADGKLQAAPLEKFSNKDQEYVKQQLGLGNAAKPAAAAPEAPAAEAAPANRFDAQIAANPQDPRGYYLRGLALVNKGKADDALVDFNKAIAIDPKFADAYDGRGLANMKAGKAVQAHEDFSKAIGLNPDLASAYRHRGDNLTAVAKTEEGRKLFQEASEDFHKKYNLADKSNTRNTAWQPLNTTSGNSLMGGINMMAKADYDRAIGLEGNYGGGYSGGGGGYAYGGGPGVVVAGPAPVVVAPAPGIVTVNPPLAVYPAEVTQGDYVTLVANPSELAKGMPSKIGANGKAAPTRVKGGNKEDIVAVEFYRDVDGDNKLNTEKDKLLGTDGDGKDGYSIKVSTAEFNPGTQAYFALPKAKEGSGPNAAKAQAVTDAISLLEQAAAAEREIAKASAEAAQGAGYTKEDADKLAAKQQVASDNASKAYKAISAVNPEATAALKEAATEIQSTKNALGAAQMTPGDASKPVATSSAQTSEKAATKLAEAAAKLRPNAEALASAAASGRGAGASGKINPAAGGPAPTDTAGGPDGKGGDGDGDGKGGKGGYGKGGRGGYGRDGGYVDRDDFARDRVAIDDTVSRARDFYADRDYDSAIREYDRLVVTEPDNVTYVRERAGAYLENGSYDYAIRDYDRLLSVETKNADLYYNRGCAYLAVGKLDEAVADFTESIKLDETRNLAFTNRGTSLARKGMFKEAVTDFTKAIDMNPSDKLAYRNRALAFKKLGDMDKAAADIAKLETIGGE